MISIPRFRNFIPNYLVRQKRKDQVNHLDNCSDHEKVFPFQKVGIVVGENFLEWICYVKPISPFLELDESLTE